MVSDALLQLAAKSYGFDASTLTFISESTNQIYSFQKEGKGYILRLSRRPAECLHQTKAEMDWLYYLASKGLSVSLPLADINGRLVMLTEYDSQSYIVSAFEAVGGKFWDKNNPDRWNDRIFYNWGKAMGEIHNLTKDYSPANPTDVREAFNGRQALMPSIKACPSVNNIAEALIDEMMSLPKGRDSYGLIHYDIHPWNFFVEGDKINLFDFDDSLYGWFALDMGIALYHGLWWGRKNDEQKDFTESIIKNFIGGYLSGNQLTDFWLSKIPLFMRFRQVCKFSWFYNPQSEDENQRERRVNIENNVLFTDCQIDNSLFARP